MTIYTTPNNLPILETSDKIAAPGDGLLLDINALALAASTAITAEGARAEGSAKTYADGKDTTNRSAWAAADATNLTSAKNYADSQDVTNLASAKTYADSKDTSNRSAWAAADATNLTSAKSYADATFIPAWKASTAYAINQKVIAPNGDVVSAKAAHTSGASYTAANWNASTQDGRIGVVEVRTTTQNLGTADLDTIKAAGVYGQNTTGNATAASHYPEVSRGSLYVEQVSGTSTLTQRYTASFTQNVYVREFYNAAWGAWKRQTPGAVTVLTTEDLDAIKTTGTFAQNTGGNATPERHYPEVARGKLEVAQISGTSTVSQVFTATSSGTIYSREFYASAWGAWSTTGGAGAGGTSYDPRLSDAESGLAIARADISVLNGEQDTQDGRLTTLEAQTGLSNPVTGAQVDGGGLLTFTLADSSVTNGVPIPASLPVDQIDYVEQLRRRSVATAVELKKIDSTGRIEVSTVAPSGLHTTYEFKGAGNGTTDDDYRMQQRIWVGDSTGATRNKTTLIGPSSNRDFAIQIAPTGSGLTPAFMPDHGPATAWNVEATRYYNSGALIDIAAMSVGQVLPLTGTFEVVQHVMGRHPDAPTTDLLEMWTTHTIHPDGVMSTDGRMRVVTPTTIGPGYFIMCPVAADVFDTVVSSLNNSYPNNAGLVGTNTFLPESDVATSYVFVSSINRGVGVAVRYNNPAETIRRGQPDKVAAGARTWLEHRAGGLILKLYQLPWSAPLDLPVGYTHRFSGDFLYTQAPNTYDQLAL